MIWEFWNNSSKSSEVKMFPLSFAEFWSAWQRKEAGWDIDQLFLDYLRFGGIPVVANYLLDD